MDESPSPTTDRNSFLTIPEILHARYPLDKINHWEIKCLYGEHEHFGIFWYKYGTPFDKEPVHGICSPLSESLQQWDARSRLPTIIPAPLAL